MGKVSSPNNDHKNQEDYSKSNSVEVQNSQESSASLSPPDLFVTPKEDTKQEEEETQEVQSESITFDIPSDGDDSNSGDDDSEINDDDVGSESESTDPKSIFDPYGDYATSEINDAFDSKNQSSSSDSSQHINPYGKDSKSDAVTSFKKANVNASGPFKLSETAQLKKNFEHNYGFDLSDTKVVQNSQEPAQFKAHAFARGNEVHLGPGQDHQLGHELAHVVQQKQGKVIPTSSENGMLINDDPALEREADQMGQKAAQLKAYNPANNVEASNTSSLNQPTYQFSKPDKKAKKDDGKVEKKLSIVVPEIKLPEKKMKYVNVQLGVASSLSVAFMVDKAKVDMIDEIAFGPKGVAAKTEGPNLVKSEIADKLNIEVKNGLEINSFGGKAGIECKLGDKSLFAGAGIEFTYVEMDWNAPIEDKIKILPVTLKSPTVKLEDTWTFGGEPRKVSAQYNVQLGLDLNKTELLKKIISRFGHLATAEFAIAGGMILGGAMAIGIACHNIHMGKDIRKRIDANIDKILSYGHGFKAGYTGKSNKPGSFQGAMAGFNARMDTFKKIPPLVFDKKLKEKGFDSILFPAMYQAVQKYKQSALDQFKKDHDVDDDNDSNNDLKLFKEVLDASVSSKYLEKKILEI